LRCIISDLNNWLQTTLIANGLYSTINGTPTTFISFAYNPINLKVTVTASPCTGGTAANPSTPSYYTVRAGGPESLTSTTFLSGNTPSLYFGQLNLAPLGETPVSTTGAVTNASVTGLSTLVGSDVTQTYPSVLFTSNGYIFPSTTTTVTLPSVPQDNEYNTVLVNCNLVNSKLMPQYNRVIFDFAPSTAAAGTQLTFSPYPDFYACEDGYYNSIIITFVDENESPVPILDPTMSITIIIRPRPVSERPDESDLGKVKSLGTQFAPPPSQDYNNRPPAAPIATPSTLSFMDELTAAAGKKRARPETALERPMTTFPNELTSQVAAAHAKRLAKKNGAGLRRHY
jgi:hypothetical protein